MTNTEFGASCSKRGCAIFAAALLFLLPGGPVQSQVTLTVLGGPNIATLAYAERPGTLKPWSRHGGALGLAVGFPVSDSWGVQLGVGLSSKGYNGGRDCESARNPLACSEWVDYLESTVLVDRRFELGSPVLHLLAGPFLGYQLATYLGSPFDYGVAFGAQLDLELYGKLRLSLGPLYSHGLKSNSYRVATIQPPAYTRTRTLTLRTGLSYSIG